MAKIEQFEDLIVWQEALAFTATIYQVTKAFPVYEQFGITAQIRRSASSVTANITEGFGRRTKNDKLHFYTIAYGSLLETKNFCYLAEKLGFIDAESRVSLTHDATEIQKLLNAFMRPLR